MPQAKTILIVDDDHELIDGLRSLLERQGHRVIQAHDGHQGKQAIYNQRPDLVIEAGETPAEPTTVVDWSQGAPEVLRLGAGDPDRFEDRS